MQLKGVWLPIITPFLYAPICGLRNRVSVL